MLSRQAAQWAHGPPGHRGRGWTAELAEQQVAGGQGDRLRAAGGSSVGAAAPPAGRAAALTLDRDRETAGHLREPDVARGEQRVQVFHGLRMAAQQPPGPVEFLFAERSEGRQRFRQLESAITGQRANVVECERRPAGPGRAEWMAAGNEQPAAMGFAAPARYQFAQGRIADRPAAGIGRHVVVEVVQDQQDRHLAEDQFAQQGQPVSPRQVGPVRRPHRLRLATALSDRRVTAKRRGHPAQHPVDRHLAADDRGDPLGLEMAHPRDDLAGQCGLADSAGPCRTSPARSGPVRSAAQRRRSAERIGRDASGSLSGPAVLAGQAATGRSSWPPTTAGRAPSGPGFGPSRSAVPCGAVMSGELSFAKAKSSGRMRAGVTIRNPPCRTGFSHDPVVI